MKQGRRYTVRQVLPPMKKGRRYTVQICLMENGDVHVAANCACPVDLAGCCTESRRPGGLLGRVCEGEIG